MKIPNLALIPLALGLLTSHAARADVLVCEQSGNGYHLKNLTKNIVIGEGSHYFEAETCERARATKVEVNGFGVVCAAKNDGSAIFRLDGTIVGLAENYFTALALCAQSIGAMSDWVVCAPKSTGSAPFDLRTNQFVGREGAYYNSIEFCQWSSRSASSADHFMCASNGTGSAIYVRGTNQLATNRDYSSAEECFHGVR